ncbi:hypothetical protein PIROE2DRAFT_65208 [Piromyces sp. E2]|nr:hypothetical protein PIROE2DRAFT_65208 [Piromyces sp. E2]|eukprot:OUM57073.1 hypothetical protein PIROE2DRAFT_65208 [Piromyces sp. E2]
MPKTMHMENAESHSKKWFTKISLKIPKKLKNGKNASNLTNALNNAKKNNTLERQLKQSDNKQITFESKGETNSVSSNTLITQTSQLTISSKNESTINSESTPVIRISTISTESNEDDANAISRNMDINSNTVCSIKRSNGLIPYGHGHCRSISDYAGIPFQRPRSYSDTPVPRPIQSTTSYYDDDYMNDTKPFDVPKGERKSQLGMVKENYYHEKDIDLCDKTPVLTTNNTPIDTSNFPTPSNTITPKDNAQQSTSAGNTPVLKHQEVAPSRAPSRKFNNVVELMQCKPCDNMTAKEFALAVGISIRDSDSEDEDYDSDRNSISTLSSTLSQLTANGKVPTADEIYNAVSFNSLNRQKRKHSAPILNLDMFHPPAPGECMKSASSCHSFKSELNNHCPRAMGDLSHKSSNPKFEKRLPLKISTLKSTESNLTCVASKYSSASSIQSSHSGNTTTFIPDLPDNDCDSYCSCGSSYLQQPMNSSPDINKNNISTTFYSLPRITLHSPINPSKPTNHRDKGIGGRHHNRISSAISINSQSSNKKIPSSPATPSPTLQNASLSKMNDIEAHNMYINSKTIATSSRPINTPSPINSNKYPTSSSWSNGLNEIENLRFTPKNAVKKQVNSENKVEIYTKGRFTITHETYSHKRKASTHKFQVEKN